MTPATSAPSKQISPESLCIHWSRQILEGLFILLPQFSDEPKKIHSCVIFSGFFLFFSFAVKMKAMICKLFT